MAALGTEPGLLLAFVSGGVELSSAAAALQLAAGEGVPTAGMTGSGLISAGGPLEEGCVALALGPQVRASIAVGHEASRDLRAAGRISTAAAVAGLESDADMVLLLLNSSRGDIADIVGGAYEAAGPALPLAGGAASGAEKRFFHNGEDSEDSVVAVAIASKGALAVGESQTCRTQGDPSIVTRSEGQRVEEIDGRPAEEVYLEQIGFAGVALDGEQFEDLAITHPLAQPELHGDVRLRHVLGKTGDGGIIVGTHIPPSAVIEFTELDFDELLSSGAESVRRAGEGLGEAAVQAALVFDCAGRRRALRGGLDQEIAAITAPLGGGETPVAGLYTNGEVARLRGAKGDRNHAVVTVAFG